VELVKSAGFPEFDAEAVSAVKRAAPFPPIGAQRLVELRIPFQNPVVK
jgi:TonB family protein